MKKSASGIACLLALPFLLSGCGAVGSKSLSLPVIYAASSLLGVGILVGYACFSKKLTPWLLMLLFCVTVVNTGYFMLSVSGTLEMALWSNRISYLGSVFLPLSMWMIIINATHISYRKWIPGVLLALAAVMFFIAASPGYLPIYYKNVSFTMVNGVGTLVKEYGPLHSLYLVYLVGYFGTMVATIVYATAKDKIDSLAYAVIIAIAVFVNLGVWLIEQLVYIEFEILSISYIISECFLLGLHILMAEAEKHKIAAPPAPVQPETTPSIEVDPQQLALFVAGLSELTPKERELYECYIAGLTTDVIMEKLAIKENTLKFHSKNLYSKLGVKSRKQLVALYRKSR